MKGCFYKGNHGMFEVVPLISQNLLERFHQPGICQTAIKSDGSIRDGGARRWQLPEL